MSNPVAAPTPRFATLAVRVVDAATGAPIPKAAVFASADSPECEHSWNVISASSGTDQDMVATDDAGAATLRVPSGQDYWMSAGPVPWRNEFERRSLRVPALAAGEQRALAIGLKTAPDRWCRGRVVRAADGEPLAGIELAFGAPGCAPSEAGGERTLMLLPCASAWTDAAGRFDVLLPSWQRNYVYVGRGVSPQLAFVDTQGAEPCEAPTLEVESSSGLEIELRLPASSNTSSVRVRARAAVGALVVPDGSEPPDACAGASIEWPARRGADGVHRFVDLPADTPLTLSAMTGDRVLAAFDDSISLAPGETRRVMWDLSER